MGRGLRQSPEVTEGTAPASVAQRVDKWLWHARIVKTRVLAVELVEHGKVRRNRERLTKAADQVRTGDVLTITLPSRVLVVRIVGQADRRGSADDAAGLYVRVESGSGGSDA